MDTTTILTFPISRDPPEGGTPRTGTYGRTPRLFPISRDPPEGGTNTCSLVYFAIVLPPLFPISRDPPEGGT